MKEPAKQKKYDMKQKVKSLIRKIIPQKYYPQCIDLYVKCKYSAIKFKCPFCGAHSGTPLPTGFYLPVLKEQNVVGAGYRLNAKCPRCHSSDRERLIYLYLKNRTNVFHDKLRILHVAPERNLQEAFMAAPNNYYLSADLHSPQTMVQMDITHIQYRDNSFDVIICNHVLEHIVDDRKAMSELYRVLKPGGWAILQVPISPLLSRTLEDPNIIAPEEREKVFGQSDHVRIYGKDYIDRLERAGFSVQAYSSLREFGWLAIHKYALQKDENVYIGLKPKQGNM